VEGKNSLSAFINNVAGMPMISPREHTTHSLHGFA